MECKGKWYVTLQAEVGRSPLYSTITAMSERLWDGKVAEWKETIFLNHQLEESHKEEPLDPYQTLLISSRYFFIKNWDLGVYWL